MKTTILLAIICCGYFTLFSQDSQWLIRNGLGKSGYNGFVNIFSNPVTSAFYLEGVSGINTATTGARNDLLAIFSDGTHQNTRYEPGRGLFYTAGLAASMTTHNFSVPAPKNLRHLYLTNRYESDDMPANVKAITGSSTTAGASYSFSTTNSPLISAHHDVVPNKDITLIIRYDSLDLFPDNSKEKVYTLRFDGLRSIGTDPVSYGNDIFDLEPAFGSPLSAVYTDSPGPAASATSISLTRGTHNWEYVNLKTTSLLSSFVPTSPAATHEAIFTLYKNGNFVRHLAEPIRRSHDPNFLQVQNICREESGDYIITYHVEFENYSDVSEATDLRVEITFPAYYDLSCLNPKSYKADGYGCGGNETVVGQKVTFQFTGNRGILFNHSNRQLGQGYIEFNVRIDGSYDVTNVTNTLHLADTKVFFDGTGFQIMDFRDLIECNLEGQNPAGVKEPNPGYETEVAQKDSPQSKLKVKQEDEPSGESYRFGMKEPEKLPPYACYRPLTPGDCKCKFFPWWAVYAGAAILIGLAGIAFAIQRRRTMPPAPTPPTPTV